MIKKPHNGDTCWIIVDIWETICAAPVTIIGPEQESYADVFIKSKTGEYTVRWELSDDYSEAYGGYTRKELYKTSTAAWQAIKAKGGVMP